MGALGHQIPKCPPPPPPPPRPTTTTSTQTRERQSVVRVREGKGHNWESFLEEVAFEFPTVECRQIFAAQEPKAIRVLPLEPKSGVPPAS